MVTHFGSQCGFCTPGFVMAMAHMADFDRTQDSQHIRQKLAGNLCRCTGYEAIVTAAQALLAEEAPRLTTRFDTAAMEKEFDVLRTQPVEVAGSSGRFYKPANLDQALSYLAHNSATRLVAGATDLGVQSNKGKLDLRDAMFIAHLTEICALNIGGDQLEIGAAVNWSDLLQLSRQKLPELAAILEIFAAEQIRNAATLGGNIMNASPIADSLPCLFVLDAELVLASSSGSRTVPIGDFYQGYKKMDIRPDEMLVQVRLKLPKAGSVLRLYKVSKRRDLDISTITLGAYVERENGVVRLARFAAGGMGPTVLRLIKTEATITGREPDDALRAEIDGIALTEVTPISDVRGSAEFRRLLLRNLLRRFFDELKAREVLPA
jgi:xanthine dehydrogenase small subunit